MKVFNQELSIKANKEFTKGNVDKAWEMQLESNTLVEGATKEKWVAFQTKINEKRIQEEKLHERNYPSFNRK